MMENQISGYCGIDPLYVRIESEAGLPHHIVSIFCIIMGQILGRV